MNTSLFLVKRMQKCRKCDGIGSIKGEYLRIKKRCNICNGRGQVFSSVPLKDALKELGADILYHK